MVIVIVGDDPDSRTIEGQLPKRSAALGIDFQVGVCCDVTLRRESGRPALLEMSSEQRKPGMAQVQIRLIISSGRKVRPRVQVVEGGHGHT